MLIYSTPPGHNIASTSRSIIFPKRGRIICKYLWGAGGAQVQAPWHNEANTGNSRLSGRRNFYYYITTVITPCYHYRTAIPPFLLPNQDAVKKQRWKVKKEVKNQGEQKTGWRLEKQGRGAEERDRGYEIKETAGW